ncbi:uncharacterized protein [Ptychodera flava]|uniref:uncharacterized protein n=1 Tax=Ptychodera flava TaxID=63121 RepID=UPI00396AAF2E
MGKAALYSLIGCSLLCMAYAAGFDTFFFEPTIKKDIADHHFFVSEPKDLTVHVNMTAMFTCSVGNKKGLVAWVKTTGPKDRTILSLDNSVIVGDSRLMIGSRVGGRDYDLIVFGVTRADEGFYTCFVSAGGQDPPIVSASALLTVI